MIRRNAGLLAALTALAAVSCSAKSSEYQTNVEITRIRPIRRDDADWNHVLTIDVEVSYAECPGEQRRMIRGDADFAACILKHKVGDKVPAKLSWGPKDDGTYGHKILQLGDCVKKLDPKDEAAYEIVQDCEPIVVNDVEVGVHCDRKRSPALIDKCPWFRLR